MILTSRFQLSPVLQLLALPSHPQEPQCQGEEEEEGEGHRAGEEEEEGGLEVRREVEGQPQEGEGEGEVGQVLMKQPFPAQQF